MRDEDSNEPDLNQAEWSPDPATVPCPECGGEVSEEADRCPECGYYFTPGESNAGRTVWYRLAVAFVIGLLVWTLIVWW